MNRWATYLLLPLLLFGTLGFVQAQIENAVRFSYQLEPSKDLVVGQEISLTIEALIDPGYHMYSANQVEGMEMMAATFELDKESDGVELVGAFDDKGKKETKFDDVFENDISLYHDKVTYTQTIKITKAKASLAGFMRYQVCDDSQCIPGSYDVVTTLKAAEKKAEPKPAPPPPPPPKQQKKAIDKSKKTTPEQKVKQQLPIIKQEQAPSISDVAKTNPSSKPHARFDNAVTWEQVWSHEGEPKKGDEFTISFKGKINSGFHVYSSIPPKKPAGLPTTFNLNGESYGVELLGDLTEEGEAIKKYDEIFETDVIQFEDEVTFLQKIKVTEDNPVIDAYLAYQICDEGACVNEKVEIYETWGNESPSHLEEKTGSSSSTDPEGSSLWVLMLQGLLLGFASVLTPCVFPMIPLTVSIFAKNENKSRAASIRDAFFYGFSIITIFTGLTVFLVILFGAEIIQVISNSPSFNVFFFVLLFVLALSFLGMFDIQLPASWSNAANKGSERGGLIGIFFMALTLVIVSFSCTGPVVGMVLGWAATGKSYLAPIMTMFAFSLALALPFMLLAVFPQWLNSLPRSGGWLNAVKVVLGMLELALAFIYLSRADLVMHWGILDREIFLGAWIVIFSMLGFYLLGKIRLPHDSPVDRISVPRFLMSMGTFWFVLYLVPGLWGASLPMLGGFLPANTKGIGVILQDGVAMGPIGASSTNDICSYPDKISGHLSGDTPRGFCAFYDLEQGMEYAKQVNKPVFLDFTGHTCANCRYLEKTAWQDEEVRRYITEEFVLISLYTDDRQKLAKVEKTSTGKKLRTVGDKWIQYQLNTYNTGAQPYYVLLDHDKSSLISPTGFNPPLDVQVYRDFFKRGLEEFRQRH